MTDLAALVEAQRDAAIDHLLGGGGLAFEVEGRVYDLAGPDEVCDRATRCAHAWGPDLPMILSVIAAQGGDPLPLLVNNLATDSLHYDLVDLIDVVELQSQNIRTAIQAKQREHLQRLADALLGALEKQVSVTYDEGRCNVFDALGLANLFDEPTLAWFKAWGRGDPTSVACNVLNLLRVERQGVIDRSLRGSQVEVWHVYQRALRDLDHEYDFVRKNARDLLLKRAADPSEAARIYEDVLSRHDVATGTTRRRLGYMVRRLRGMVTVLDRMWTEALGSDGPAALSRAAP